MRDVFTNILVSCPNNGGLFLFHRGATYKLDGLDTTGLVVREIQMLRALQPARLVRFGEGHWDGVTSDADFDDIHDVLLDGKFHYVVKTDTNEIIKLDQYGQEQLRWTLPGERDSWHVNCLARWNNRVVFSAFGDLRSHREYKVASRGFGFVQDLVTGVKLITDLSQPHSLLAVGDKLLLANSESSEIREYDAGGRLLRSIKLEGYTRGILLHEGVLFVGLSKSRNADCGELAHALVIALDAESWEEIDRRPLPVDEIYNIQSVSEAAIVEILAKLASYATRLLGDRVVECERKIVCLEGRAEAVERQIEQARLEIEAKEGFIRDKDLEIQCRDNVIRNKEIEAQSRESELCQFKADRDARIAALEGALLDRDTKINEQNESLAKYARQIDDVASDLAIKARELVELQRLFDASGTELKRLTVAKEVLEDMNSRMRNTIVWRLANKLGLIKTLVAAQGGGAVGTGEPKGFDAAWYLREYPDVAASGMDPYQHYILNGKSEGRQPAARAVSPPRLRKVRFLRSGLLSTIKQAGGLRKAVEKVVTVAKRDDWFVAEFDEAFYLEKYPDIREAGIEPYEHFVQYGRAEGRMGRSPRLKLHKGSVLLDATKKTVLVVSHEASRTGAPILSLNIARELQKRFNVIVLVLGDGPMMQAFCEVVPVVVGPMPVNGNVGLASAVITELALSHEFEFAIVNSIESRFVLRKLMELSIPAISLIHEFAAYTRPLDAFPFAIFWSAETVFSARITHENAVAGNAELAGQPFHIMPQGRCTMLAHAVHPDAEALERRRLLRILRPGGDAGRDIIVIVGIGYVQYRKGVDLFLRCAARVIKSEGGERCRFVWIGKGYDPVNDMAYSTYLAEQLQRSGLQRKFAFSGETAAIEQVYESADILMLSSRLDPLPNVAIDAMAHGLPVVCFANTTGVVDALVDSGLAEECVAPYLDTTAMAELVLELARSKNLRSRVGVRLQQTVREQFDMERYVSRLEGLARDARLRLRNEVESTKVILDSALIRPDFFLRPGVEYSSPDDMVRYGYVRSWAAGISKRKPFPGFHPGIYAEQHGVGEPGLDPLASYVRAGMPEGPWRFEVISSDDDPVKASAELRVALHLHVYYPDLLGEILRRLSMNVARPDLFVSVPNENVAALVRKIMRKYAKQLIEVEVVPNAGRDLGPLLTAFSGSFIDHYDIVGHLHTKKSLDIADESTGKVWSQFLMENLLGGKVRMADLILGRMESDPSIGIVFPDDPNIVGWGANRPYAEQLGVKLGLYDFSENFAFPVGSMFWARTDAIRPLFDLGLDWQDYPAEPLPYDGSMLHALERLLPHVVEKRSARIVLTNVAGVTR